MPAQIPDIPYAYRVDAPQNTKWHEVHIAPDGQTVYVHQHTLMVDVVAVMADTTQRLLLLAVFIVVVWYIVYVIRHRKELAKAGVPSCRRCHYDLTGIVAVEKVPRGKRTRFQTHGEPTRPTCPECGINLKAHKPIVGQKRQRMLWSPDWNAPYVAGIAIFYAVLGGGWLIKSNLSWLSEGAGAWANRQTLSQIRDTASPRDVLSTIDPATGALIRRVARESRYSFSGSLSPDGRSWMRFANVRFRRGYFVSTPINPGGHALNRRIPIGTPFNIERRILAFTNQGNAALIVGTDLDDNERLLEIDLQTGDWREHFSQKLQRHIPQGVWHPDRNEDPRFFIRYGFESDINRRGMVYEIFPWQDTLQPRQGVVVQDREAALTTRGTRGQSTLVICGRTGDIIGLPLNPRHGLVRIDRETGDVLASINPVGIGRSRGGELQLGWQDDRLIFLTLPDDRAIFVYDLIHDQWIARLTHPPDLRIQSLAVNHKADHIHAVGWFRTVPTNIIVAHWPHGMNTALLAWDTTPIREALARLDAANP